MYQRQMLTFYHKQALLGEPRRVLYRSRGIYDSVLLYRPSYTDKLVLLLHSTILPALYIVMRDMSGVEVLYIIHKAFAVYRV